jgi:protein-S-isoprenylcysteine O-methyltransferase Ste14
VVRCGALFYRYRKFFIPGTLLLVLAAFPLVVPGGDRRLDLFLDLFGFVVALSGQALRAAVIGYVYIRRGGKEGRAYADELVTGGFFAHARNPLYLGNLIILTGLLIIYNSPGGYLIALPLAVFFYAAIVASEEAYLRTRFGKAYEEYCRQVPRWIPAFGGLRRTVGGMRFNWHRLVRKEYGSAYGWISAAILLRVWEAATHEAYEAERPYLAWYLLPLGLVTAGWAVARFMKKRRLLVDRPTLSASRA